MHNAYTADIYVMGILPSYHRKGIGTQLVAVTQKYLVEQGYKLFMVKTLGPSSDYAPYARTREFYRSVGFYPLEEIKQIWDEENPCLILVKGL